MDDSRQRRLLAHAFSDKALREQEPLVQRYVDLLTLKLAEAGKEIDVVRWLSYCTFDIIADLTFGDSFRCLEEKQYHPWVNMVFASAKIITLKTVLRYFPILDKIGKSLVSKKTLKKRHDLYSFTFEKVESRLSMETSRPDFMTYITRHVGEKGMTLKEIQSTAALFLIAGSETTATALSGTVYLLLQNLQKLKKLVKEIRNAFKTANDVTMEEASKLPYLLAVLQEGLRMFPPVPTGFPRKVPTGGDTIGGHWIPENVSYC
jgi:cytochrome P450